jgi:hypothetical protein
VISVEKFTEPVNYNHWECPALSGYIYSNVLEEHFFKSIKKEAATIVDSQNKFTYLTNALTYVDNGKTVKLGLNPSNGRYQNVLFDITYHQDYWYQTENTIQKWADDYIRETCSPKFVKFLKTMKTVEPFNDNKWIPYRLHINYLFTLEDLSLHLDTNTMLYKDYENSKAFSLTYYLHNHKPNTGGELYSINGWSFKPKENVAVAINGHHVLHGVTRNINEETRLAFTTRWIHVDDMYLPGHPDKMLYKLDKV